VVTGEFDQGYDCAHPPTSPAALTTFDTTYMAWADQHGVGYLAWGWWVLGATTSAACSSLADPGDQFALVSSYAGTPVAPDGTALHTHLAALATSPPLTVRTAALPAATVGVPYAAGLSAGGGNPPYRWSLASGRLPRGLHLRPTGTITGRPRTAGTVVFTVKVTDHRTKAKPHTKSSAFRTLSLTVG
jgi:Putative Ig domain